MNNEYPNFEYVDKTVKKILYNFYSSINDYLQNILNSPSTANKLIKHYAVASKDDEPYYAYILFDNKIVRRFEINLTQDNEKYSINVTSKTWGDGLDQ